MGVQSWLRNRKKRCCGDVSFVARTPKAKRKGLNKDLKSGLSITTWL
jgi:hypothetical protein